MALSQFFQLNTTCNCPQLQPNITTLQITPKFYDGSHEINAKFLFEFVLINTTVTGLFYETDYFSSSWQSEGRTLTARKAIPLNFQPNTNIVKFIKVTNYWNNGFEMGTFEISDGDIKINCDFKGMKTWYRQGNKVYGFGFSYLIKPTINLSSL